MNTGVANAKSAGEIERSTTNSNSRDKTKRAAKKKGAHGKATSKARNSRTKHSRPGSKKDVVLQLLRLKEGATIAEIAKATEWQNHSIRGFLSGTVSKKMGLAVESVKNEAGERTYRITP